MVQQRSALQETAADRLAGGSRSAHHEGAAAAARDRDAHRRRPTKGDGRENSRHGGSQHKYE